MLVELQLDRLVHSISRHQNWCKGLVINAAKLFTIKMGTVTHSNFENSRRLKSPSRFPLRTEVAEFPTYRVFFMKLRLFLSAQSTDNEKIEIKEDTQLYVSCTGVQANCFYTEWVLDEKDLNFATCDFDKLALRRSELDQSPVKLLATSNFLEATVEFKVESMSFVSDFLSPM